MRCVCHTHSDYKDVFDVFFSRYKKYCSLPLIVLTNKEIEGVECFVYKEDNTYKDRWISFLSTIEEDICILHEDFILYGKANIPNLPNEFDCVRLQKNGRLEYSLVENQLYEIVGFEDRFSITPSIWKSKSFKCFLERCASSAIWDLELFEQDNARDLKIGFYYDEEPPIGLFHNRSNFFPCVLSAISKGKWNYSEYKTELEEIFYEFGVDKNIRGVL